MALTKNPIKTRTHPAISAGVGTTPFAIKAMNNATPGVKVGNRAATCVGNARTAPINATTLKTPPINPCMMA
nr:hypothetical protein [uncultured Tateyamaria sp.]